jgi:hypothetical protein
MLEKIVGRGNAIIGDRSGHDQGGGENKLSEVIAPLCATQA